MPMRVDEGPPFERRAKLPLGHVTAHERVAGMNAGDGAA